jgi:hypothetical protein
MNVLKSRRRHRRIVHDLVFWLRAHSVNQRVTRWRRRSASISRVRKDTEVQTKRQEKVLNGHRRAARRAWRSRRAVSQQRGVAVASRVATRRNEDGAERRSDRDVVPPPSRPSTRSAP